MGCGRWVWGWFKGEGLDERDRFGGDGFVDGDGFGEGD